jgi:mono/diheme cytochrome c family protein
MGLHRGAKRLTCGALGMWLMTLAACGGGNETSADVSAADRELAVGRRTSTTLVAQPANTEGRLLASNCFQCHGTLGTGGFDKIRGSEASEVLEFMTKTANRDIMAAHAQGYTPEQLNKIIAYLKQ